MKISFLAPVRSAFLRIRWVLILFTFAAGGIIATLERWRPEVIEDRGRRVQYLASFYLDPLREATHQVRRLSIRIGDLWAVENEAASLRREVIQLTADLQSEREEVKRLTRVSGLTQWQSSSELEFLSADVVGFSTDAQSAVLTINRGLEDGLWEGLPVVGRHGLAGVIREVAFHSANVQALTDPLSAVGVADMETRSRGMVLGRGRETPLEFIPENEVQPIPSGTILITSGFGNSLYPKGLVVGTVRERKTNKRGLVYGAIEPAESFNALEEVLVIRPSNREHAREGLGQFRIDMPTSPTLATRRPPVPLILTPTGLGSNGAAR